MILRKAELKDFKVYKKMLIDKDSIYHWLYYNKTAQEILSKKSNKDYSDISDIIDFYQNYSIERFEKDLEENHIFMIEENSQILGYISLFYCNHGDYKIEEWAMLNADDNEIKDNIIKQLVQLKLPRLRSYTICTPNDNVIKFLLSVGFYKKADFFYKLEVKVKE